MDATIEELMFENSCLKFTISELKTEGQSLIYGKILDMHDYVSKYGVDNAFVKMYNSHGELDALAGMTYPCTEAFDLCGYELLNYQHACMEGILEGIGAVVKWVIEKIKQLLHWIGELWDKFCDLFRPETTRATIQQLKNAPTPPPGPVGPAPASVSPASVSPVGPAPVSSSPVSSSPASAAPASGGVITGSTPINIPSPPPNIVPQLTSATKTLQEMVDEMDATISKEEEDAIEKALVDYNSGFGKRMLNFFVDREPQEITIKLMNKNVILNVMDADMIALAKVLTAIKRIKEKAETILHTMEARAHTLEHTKDLSKDEKKELKGLKSSIKLITQTIKDCSKIMSEAISTKKLTDKALNIIGKSLRDSNIVGRYMP